MADASIAVLTDAKAEYTKQLIAILRDNIYQGVKSIYEDARSYCNENNTPKEVLIIFQKFLSQIPKWSQELIEKEYSRIIDNSQCDWLEDLITAVFISHTKVLTLVNQGKTHKKINIKIPKPSHFMHLCYIETAREVWRKPFIFSENMSQYEYQKNVGIAETTIENAIAETIRKQLPVKHILREYLGDGYGSEPDEEEDFKKPVSDSQKRNLKKMIKKELEQNDDNGENDDLINQSDEQNDVINSDEDEEDEEDEMTHLRRIIREEMNKKNTKNKKSSLSSSSKSITKSTIKTENNATVENTVSTNGLNVLDIDLLGHGNDNYITDTETENENEPQPITEPIEITKDATNNEINSVIPNETLIISNDARTSPIPVEIEDLNMDLDIIEEPINQQPSQSPQPPPPQSPPPQPQQPKEDYKDVIKQPSSPSSDIKEVSLTSKLTNGFKNLLGFNNETKINKIDDNNVSSNTSSYNIDGIENKNKKSVSIQEQPQQPKKQFEIKELDDIDLEDLQLQQNNTDNEDDGNNGGGLSDLDLDCDDVDLNDISNKKSSASAPVPTFTFF